MQNFQFEFINHTIGFVCLTLVPKMTRTARESNPYLLSSAEALKQIALTTQPQKLFPNRYKGTYIGGRSNGVTTEQETNEWAVKTPASTEYLLLKFNETRNHYLTHILVFSTGVEYNK